ncbi:thioredoxin-like protein [Flagelloscypha sp. PMI_526]|nr:thioredoxin-like protein [Flagelloscypha sp. PMI_526]
MLVSANDETCPNPSFRSLLATSSPLLNHLGQLESYSYKTLGVFPHFLLQVKMNLFFYITLLCPWTLLAAPTSASQTTLPAPLDPSTFSDTINQKGLWFVEHFSPWCGHCKAFAPDWEKLYGMVDADVGSEVAKGREEVRLRQVDCAVNGDLCNKNGIAGYPTLIMYRDGAEVEQFKGARDMEKLKSFITKHQKVTEAPHISEEAPRRNVNPDGISIHLTDKTFWKALEDAGGQAFVKFYAPWCGHCKKMAGAWKGMAARMQGKLLVAEVDCEANKSFCTSQNVQGFPTLAMYSGGSKNEYSGSRKLEGLTDYAEKAVLPAISPLEGSQLANLVKSEQVLYVLLTRPDYSSAVSRALSPIIAPLLSQPRVYHITSSSDAVDLWKMWSIPDSVPWALVALREGDETPASIFPGKTPNLKDQAEVDGAKFWVQTHTLGSMYELEQATFQTIMNGPAEPLVVIAAAPTDLHKTVEDRLKEIAKKWRVRVGSTGRVGTTSEREGREVIFSFMDSSKWADWMKSMYGISAYPTDAAGKTLGPDGRPMDLEDVKVIVADHKRLIYWPETRQGSSFKLNNSGSLFEALEDIYRGKLSGWQSENLIERIARSANNWMTAAENWIVSNIFKFIFFMLLGAAVLIWAATRFLGDSDDYSNFGQGGRGALTGKERWERQKGGRLD